MKFERQGRLYPKAYAPRRPGYGQRKRAREARKAPLLEPFLPSAEEYETWFVEDMRSHYRELRRYAARTWIRVRQWLRQATPEKRAEFERRWNARWHVPHTPEYAADLCRRIDQGAESVVAWSSESPCWTPAKRNTRRRGAARALAIALLWTTLVCRPTHADVGQGRCWLLRPQERVMLAFAYCSSFESTGKNPGDRGYGLTARSTPARYGVCAADPCVPFGTRLWVEGYGVAVVEDRGGAIRAERLDLWMPSVPQALQWGRRRVKVVVLD